MMEKLLVTKIAYSIHFLQALVTIKLDVGQSHNIVFISLSDYEATSRMRCNQHQASERYDLLGPCDFPPGFAAFDNHYKSFIFLRLSCHQQQQ